MNVIGDSPRAARYAGMRTRRKILAVMGLSGAVAGLGGASQVGDFSHVLDASPQGLQGANYGYAGIVVAALGRYNPFAVCLVARAARRPAERGPLPPGRRLPVRPRRRDAGDHPLLHARRRAPDPLPRPLRRRRRESRRRPGRPRPSRRHERQQLVPRHRARAGGALRHADPLRRARRAARGALRGDQPRRRGDDAGRRRDGFLGLAAGSRPGRCRARARRAHGRARRARDGGDRRGPLRVAAREPDRHRPGADDLRGRPRAVGVPGQRPRARRRAAQAPVRADRPLRRCRTCP